MHFHAKDVVVAYRYDGALKSVKPDGTSVVNADRQGSIYFNQGNRAHHEELTTDRQSAVMMELKERLYGYRFSHFPSHASTS